MSGATGSEVNGVVYRGENIAAQENKGTKALISSQGRTLNYSRVGLYLGTRLEVERALPKILALLPAFFASRARLLSKASRDPRMRDHKM